MLNYDLSPYLLDLVLLHDLIDSFQPPAEVDGQSLVHSSFFPVQLTFYLGLEVANVVLLPPYVFAMVVCSVLHMLGYGQRRVMLT